MNPIDFQELLQKARKRKLDEHETGLKTVQMKADCEFHGHQFLAGEQYELSQSEAKELLATGKVEYVIGGLCDVSTVKRLGREPLFAYRTWYFDAPGSGSNGPKDPYSDVMIRVRLNKSVNVIPGGVPGLRPGDEFFLPYRDLCQFEFDLETDPDQNWMKTLTVLEDQE